MDRPVIRRWLNLRDIGVLTVLPTVGAAFALMCWGSACSSPDRLGPLPDSEYPSTDAGSNAVDAEQDTSLDVAADVPSDGPTPDAAGPDASDAATPGTLVRKTYHLGVSSRDYLLYLPTPTNGQLRLLLVALHGCSQDADTFLNVTHLRSLADDQGVVLVLPEQPASANVWKCWNWFEPVNQTRASGEPALLAGIIDEVVHQNDVDPKRVFVMGLSAGGAMSLVLAATYPDKVTAVGTVAGCPFKGTPCLHQPSSLSGDQLARLAWDAMGTHHRSMPVFVMQGTADSQVPAANAELIVQQWLGVADRADDGQANGSVSPSPASSSSWISMGGRTYRQDDYTSGDSLLIRSWSIDGMDHAWPGGAEGYPFSDPTAPDATDALWAFFSEISP